MAHNANHQPGDRPHSKRFRGTGRTKQSFKDSCDINMILARYQKTGVIDHVAKHAPNYGFMSGATFTEQQMQLASAQNMFNDLPAKARAHFDNDPAKFLDYVSEEGAELTLMSDLGLTSVRHTKTTDPDESPPSDKPAPPGAKDPSDLPD